MLCHGGRRHVVFGSVGGIFSVKRFFLNSKVGLDKYSIGREKNKCTTAQLARLNKYLLHF
jgi:hypothetical protein